MRITTPQTLKSLKEQGKKFSCITSYDATFSALANEANIDVILVGDSLGMVVLGYEDTTEVTMDDMIHHLKAVKRARPKALLVADLPYGTFGNPEAAIENSKRLVDAGAEAVKAEGGLIISDTVRAIVNAGIPFLGHLGMLPQSVKDASNQRAGARQLEDRNRQRDRMSEALLELLRQ